MELEWGKKHQNWNLKAKMGENDYHYVWYKEVYVCLNGQIIEMDS